MKALTLLAAASGMLLLACMPSWAQGQRLSLGVAGLYTPQNLPVVLADRLGFFKKEGLNVEINDFAGGSKAVQALVGGSVDLITGAYEYTFRLQKQGQDVVSPIEMTRYYGAVLAVRKDKAASVKSIADVKGLTIGVTAPGSGSQVFVWYLMTKAGLRKNDASFIGVGIGSGAVAAIQNREIDAISNIDPMIAKLEWLDLIRPIVDTRTKAGQTEVFGGEMPSVGLLAKRQFLDTRPKVAQATVSALYRSLRWIDSASAEQVVDIVYPDVRGTERDIYIASYKIMLESYSRTGAPSPDSHGRAVGYFKQFEASAANDNIPLASAFDNRFIVESARHIQ